jgi:hypothetical protein
MILGGPPTGEQRAFEWKDGVMRALAMPRMGSALAHSKPGSYVVGWGEPGSSAGSGETSNAIVRVNGVMRDLGPMGGMFARAFDVNANGLVVGSG